MNWLIELEDEEEYINEVFKVEAADYWDAVAAAAALWGWSRKPLVKSAKVVT